jgi:two-component system sensor histidine kinase ChiS
VIVTKAPPPAALQFRSRPTPPPRLPLVAPAQARVLLIEDDQNSSRALADALRLEGYEVSTASDGRVGLERVVKQEPDVVLLDLGLLPGMHGFKVLEEIGKRQLPTRVLAMTSSLAPHLEHRARALGAVGVLHKPVQPRALVAAIEDLLAHA